MAKRPARIGADVSLANGKTWKQLHEDARRAIDSGIEFWPKVVLQLLDRYKEVAERNQELAQGDLFSPPKYRDPGARSGS